jgi:hypothetical protein
MINQVHRTGVAEKLSSDGQEISRLLLNPKIRRHFNSSPPLDYKKAKAVPLHAMEALGGRV